MIFSHKHEFETGRTSSVGNDILGFDAGGNIVNKPDAHSGKLDWIKISSSASKIITFIDLAGKYLISKHPLLLPPYRPREVSENYNIRIDWISTRCNRKKSNHRALDLSV